MFEARIQERATWQLIEEFVHSSQKLFDLLHLKREPRSLRSWWRERAKRKLEDRVADIDVELARRYAGVLVQILARSGTSVGDYDAKVVTIYESLRDKVLQLRDYRTFPRSFWDICTTTTASARNDRVALLKYKFMIRPFVEGIPHSPERVALLTRAYNDQRLRRPTKEEFEADIDNACTLLHRALQDEEDVSILTGGAITPELLDSITSPLEQYTEWLLKGSKADETEGESHGRAREEADD